MKLMQDFKTQKLPSQQMNISKQYLLQVISSQRTKYPEAGVRE